MPAYDVLEIPADPHEAVRQNVIERMARDNPGDPRTVPFDASDEPVRFGLWVVVGLILLVGMAAVGAAQ